MDKINNFWKFIIAIFVSQLAGIIGAVFTAPAILTWYAGILKPAFNPPNWIFAPVWTALFLLMGISSFLIWKKGLERRDVKISLVLFTGQLLLNILWSFLFFGLHNIGSAFIEIFILWLAIISTMIAFFRISRQAGWLLLPYILWVSFAAYLNYAIWIANYYRGL